VQGGVLPPRRLGRLLLLRLRFQQDIDVDAEELQELLVRSDVRVAEYV
jgi:hypothetical protein